MERDITNAEAVEAAFKALLAIGAFCFWLYAINRWLWAAVMTLVFVIGLGFLSLWGFFLGV